MVLECLIEKRRQVLGGDAQPAWTIDTADCADQPDQRMETDSQIGEIKVASPLNRQLIGAGRAGEEGVEITLGFEHCRGAGICA